MLFVIEGLDGCGKATQTELFRQRLCETGANPLSISFPNYDSDSSRLVTMYLNGEISDNISDVNAYAASSFYAADRYISFKKSWEKDYLNDRCIIADRYTTANQLYQATKQPAGSRIAFADWIADFEYNKLGLPRPDLVIMLRMPVAVSQKLMTERYHNDETKKDLHEKSPDYLQHVYDVSSEIAEYYKWHIIECADENGNLYDRKTISDRIWAVYESFKEGKML